MSCLQTWCLLNLAAEALGVDILEAEESFMADTVAVRQLLNKVAYYAHWRTLKYPVGKARMIIIVLMGISC
jgi:hypothetical protein